MYRSVVLRHRHFRIPSVAYASDSKLFACSLHGDMHRCGPQLMNALMTNAALVRSTYLKYTAQCGPAVRGKAELDRQMGGSLHGVLNHCTFSNGSTIWRMM